MQTFYGELPSPLVAKASEIKLLFCDVDGVFSDGRIYMGNQGEELKAFHTRDGYGIKALMATGIDVAVITGRQSEIVKQRMTALGIKHLVQGCDDKLKAFEEIINALNIQPEQCAYIGDDLIDWPVMAVCGLSVCVADGHPWLRQQSDYITRTEGGKGAVRELCDILMLCQGSFGTTMGQSI